MTLSSRPHTRTPRPHRHLPMPARLPVAVAAVLAAALLLPIPAAHAAASSTTCTGTSELTYTPGLTLTPQNVTFTEDDTIPSCTSTDTTITGIITHFRSFPELDVTCANAMVNTFGAGLTLRWNNGQTSKVSGLVGSETITGGIQQDTVTGTVTAGEFTGATAVINWTYLVNPLACLSPGGLTTLNGTILVQVTGL